MARKKKSLCIVLKKKILLNKDILLTLFTWEFGKIHVFAKGIKKITSRRSPHIQTGNLIEAIISYKEYKYFLDETTLISVFSKIKDKEVKLNAMYYYFFVLERLLPENQKEEQVFILSKKYLVDLSCNKNNIHKLLFDYLNKLMSILGYGEKKLAFQDLISSIENIINEKIPILVI